MRTTQLSLSVLGVAAAIEAVTGLVMILFPQVLIRLLLDADVAGALAPGRELQFLGDIGGFRVGSDLTWQLFAGYSFDFAVWQSTLHGVVGYRALAVDYSQDSGTNKNSLDLILHGPVVGLSFRW